MNDNDFMIIKLWSVNRREDNVCLNVPKKFAKKHDLIGKKYATLIDTPDGILIKSFNIGEIQ